jgi:hypothetical protein
METINRMAAVVTPLKPFFDWSESVLGKEANDCDPEAFRTVFLIPERTDIGKSLRAVYDEILEQMLVASVNDSSLWPGDLSFRNFKKWFDVQLVEMVFDAGRGPVEHD